MKSRIALSAIAIVWAMFSLPSTLAAQSAANREGVANYPKSLPLPEEIPTPKADLRLAWRNLATGEKGHEKSWSFEDPVFTEFEKKRGHYPVLYWVEEKRSFLGIPLRPKRFMTDPYLLACNDGSDAKENSCSNGTAPEKVYP